MNPNKFIALGTLLSLLTMSAVFADQKIRFGYSVMSCLPILLNKNQIRTEFCHVTRDLIRSENNVSITDSSLFKKNNQLIALGGTIGSHSNINLENGIIIDLGTEVNNQLLGSAIITALAEITPPVIRGDEEGNVNTPVISSSVDSNQDLNINVDVEEQEIIANNHQETNTNTEVGNTQITTNDTQESSANADIENKEIIANNHQETNANTDVGNTQITTNDNQESSANVDIENKEIIANNHQETNVNTDVGNTEITINNTHESNTHADADNKEIIASNHQESHVNADGTVINTEIKGDKKNKNHGEISVEAKANNDKSKPAKKINTEAKLKLEKHKENKNYEELSVHTKANNDNSKLSKKIDTEAKVKVKNHKSNGIFISSEMAAKINNRDESWLIEKTPAGGIQATTIDTGTAVAIRKQQTTITSGNSGTITNTKGVIPPNISATTSVAGVGNGSGITATATSTAGVANNVPGAKAPVGPSINVQAGINAVTGLTPK